MRIGPCKGSLISRISPETQRVFCRFHQKQHEVFQWYGRNWFSQICSHYILSIHIFRKRSLMIDSFHQILIPPRCQELTTGVISTENQACFSPTFLLHFFHQGLKCHVDTCKNNFNCFEKRFNPHKGNHTCWEGHYYHIRSSSADKRTRFTSEQMSGVFLSRSLWIKA